MQDRLHHLRRQFAALSHSSRFRIVLALCERERFVTELAREVGLSQSCTTRHVQALERAHVIRTRRDGKRVMAALATEHPELAQVVEWLRDASAGATDEHRPVDAGPATAPAGRSPRRKSTERTARPTDAARGEEGARASLGSSATPPPASEAPRPRPRDLDDFLL
jgi:ArsR family transcriptional regulator